MKNKKKVAEASTTTDETNNYNDGIWKDQRFAHLVSDPRFKNIHKSTKKVKIDKRFESMFKDDKFKLKYTVDKYGRRQSKSQTGSEDLKKYYDLSSDDEDIEAEQKREEEEIGKDDDAKDLSTNDSLERDEKIPLSLKDKLKDLSVDYARGDGALWSEDSSDDESSEEENNELFIEHVWGELDAEAPTTEDSTRRLAACNMDWDRMRASDIMVLCHSFLPTSGTILSVTIYPSEFGKERMAEEEIKGPQELTEKKLESGADDEDLSDVDPKGDENEEGSNYNMEKLRQYQLNRLKYFYAVIECNSVATADKLYKECDGLEYESTATKLDLRFIPDDMTFDDDPKDICTELPDLTKYMPRLYTTTALQQAKVELTWDENDIERKELNDKLVSGKFSDVADQELRKYVAYSSEDDSDEEQQPVDKKPQKQDDSINASKSNSISKYKALLKDINEKEKQKKNSRVEMEFSWGVGLKNKPEKTDVETKGDKDDVNHFEKILQLKKDKKKERKEEKKKLRKKHRNGGVDPGSESSEDDLPDGVDLNDPYFAEEFAGGDFADSTDQKKRKNKAKKRAMVDNEDDEKQQKAAELALLLDDGDEKKGHFSLKKIQDAENESKTKKRKKKRSKKDAEAEKALFDDDFQINTSDSRFAAVYSSHLYNIDPTDSNFKKTKGMLELIQTKLSRTAANDVISQPNAKKPKKDVAVSMLVKNIKRKAGAKLGKPTNVKKNIRTKLKLLPPV